MSAEGEKKKEVEIKDVDVTIDNKVDEMKDLIEDTFVKMVESKINDEALGKLNIILTPEIQKYFLLLCKESPEMFGDMELSLKKIIADNKIDTKDVPELLLLVNKVYSILNDKKAANIIDPYELIKGLLHLSFVVYTETNKIENTELIENMLKIIVVTIDLIKVKPLTNRKFLCFSCF